MKHSWRFYRQFERITFVKLVATTFQSVIHYGDKNDPTCAYMSTAWTLQKKGHEVLTASFCSCSSPTSSCSHHLHCGRLYCQPITRMFLFDPHERDQRHNWNRNQLCLDLCIQWIYTKWMWYESLIVCTMYTRMISNYDHVIWELETWLFERYK